MSGSTLVQKPDPLDLILEFTHLLRVAQIRVGLTETEDAVHALGLSHDVYSFKTALRSTLIKRKKDEATFDRVFELYFGGWLDLKSSQSQSSDFSLEDLQKMEQSQMPSQEDESGERDYEDEIERALQFINRFVYSPSRNDNASNLQSAMMLLSQMISKRTNTGKSQDEIRADLERAFVDAQDDEDSSNAVQSLVEEGDFEQVDFARMDNSEAQLVEEQIEKLIELLSIQLRRRLQRKTKGVIDLRKTIRRSIQFGGTPIELAYKRRRPDKPKIFVLVDISSSVESFARFFLMLTRAFQTTPITCRSFVFEDRTKEITDRLEREMSRFPRAGQAVERVLSRLRLQGWGMRRSSYGTSLKEFWEDVGSEVDRRTTIVILGDARNNYAPPKENLLASLQMKSERLLWLNPEPMGMWDGGDSVMSAYAPYCDHLYECRKLEQLRHIIQHLVKLGDYV